MTPLPYIKKHEFKLLKTRAFTHEELNEAGKRARESARDDERYQRDCRRAWRTADDWRRLARQLDALLFAGKSKDGKQGEYSPGLVSSDNPGGFDVLNWGLPRIRVKEVIRTYNKDRSAILIDFVNAHEEGVANIIAHEIGHHIDHLAHKHLEHSEYRAYERRNYAPPILGFRRSFKRAGLRTIGLEGDSHAEYIAETLGAYLSGHKLNAVLLAEVRKVLAKLPCSKAKLINEFRRKQIQRGLREGE